MKVYLSKSNHADPNVVMHARKVLQEAGHQVVEFSGGSYSNKPMLECEAMVIVPPDDFIIDIDKVYLGTGQTGQLRDWWTKKGNFDKVFQVSSDGTEVYEVYGYGQSSHPEMPQSMQRNDGYLEFGIEWDWKTVFPVVQPSNPLAGDFILSTGGNRLLLLLKK